MTLHNGDVIRVAPIWYWNSTSQIVNVHALLLGPTVGGTQLEIRDDIAQYLDVLYGPIVGAMPNTVINSGISLFNYSLGNPEIGIGADSNLDGSNANQVLPLMSCPFVWMRTGVSRVIGKKFLPPFTENSWDGNMWNSTTQGQLRDFCDIWLAPFVADNGTNIQSVVWRKDTSTYELPLDTNYSSYARTQRRRRPGVGA